MTVELTEEQRQILRMAAGESLRREAYRRVVGDGKPWKDEALVEQWYVLVTCRDERPQVELLERLEGEGLTCKAVLG